MASNPIPKTRFEQGIERLVRRVFPKFTLPGRRHLTPVVLIMLVIATLLGSWLIAWDRTVGNQNRLDEASQLLLNREFDKSLVLYQKILTRNPDIKMAWSGKGLSLLYLGRFEEALESYEKALDLDPDYLLGLQGKGISYEKLGRYDEAIACYRRIAELQPGSFNIDDQIERAQRLQSGDN